MEFGDAGLGGAHPALPFEVEGLGDHTDGENAHVTRGLGDDRCRARAGAATHAGGDEHHVGARKVVANFIEHFLGRGCADIRLRAGTEALGHLSAHLDDARRL